MGTRGVYGFRVDGADKLTYNHFDSYPTYLGEKIVGFLRDHDDDEIGAFARSLRLVDNDAEDTTYGDLYDLQGDLEAQWRSSERRFIDSHEFVHDGLFCEWGWILNLDTRELEIYQGFLRRDEPRGAGRYCARIRPRQSERDDYQPIWECARVPFDTLRAWDEGRVGAFLDCLGKREEALFLDEDGEVEVVIRLRGEVPA